MNTYDVVIVGGSASGLCAAINAARTNKTAAIAVLEQMPRVGKKILATGNGRCNLSNRNAGKHAYHNAAFVKPALSKYNVEGTLAFFKTLGLLTVEDSEGRIYPMSNTAASVLDALRFEVQRLNIELFCNTSVKKINVLKDGSFALDCSQNRETKEDTGKKESIRIDYFAAKVIIAAGGKAAPIHGSDGSGYALLKGLGHTVTPLYPALVQLTTEPTYPKQLKGIRVSAKITVEIAGKSVSEADGEVLFTEYGLSGIAAMEVSRATSEYVAQGKKGGCFGVLDLAPALSKEELTVFLNDIIKNNPDLPLEKLLVGIVPGKVGQVICKASNLYDFSAAINTPTEKQLRLMIDNTKALRLEIKGTRGFDQAQITAGGADVSEFNASTMESRKVNNLYACGEVLDVDGGCGGFNLQWAWSSGLLAGELRCSIVDVR